jgi:hypothetical protein
MIWATLQVKTLGRRKDPEINIISIENKSIIIIQLKQELTFGEIIEIF